MEIANKTNKYNNGKVYRICGPDPEAPCYIGSTTVKYLSIRMLKHRNCYKRWKSETPGFKVSCSVYQLFDKHGVDNCQIVLVELCNANSKDELRAREHYWIENSNCVNKHGDKGPLAITIEKKGWYEKNREYAIQQGKERYEHYKTAILASQKQDMHCDVCGYAVRKNKMPRHKRSARHIANLNKDKIVDLLNYIHNPVVGPIIVPE